MVSNRHHAVNVIVATRDARHPHEPWATVRVVTRRTRRHRRAPTASLVAEMVLRKSATAKRRRAAAERCKNVYRFIRLRLGDALSDREIARMWQMEWKSFAALKHGRRQVPRIEELETLAKLLDVDATFVFQAARGVPASEIAALLAREQRLRAVLERVRDAVFTLDDHGCIEDVNDGLCHLVGRPAHELARRPFLDLITVSSAPTLIGALASLARGIEVRGVELSLNDAAGRDRVVLLDAVPIIDSSGARIGTQAIARDVTEEHRLVRELDAERRLLQMIYECVPAACVLFDSDGTILAANPLVERVSPVCAAEIIGRNALEVFGDLSPARSPVTRAFMTGRIEQQTSRVRNRAGETVYVHRTAGPVVRNGRVEKVIETIVDVTNQIEHGDMGVLALWSGDAQTKEQALLDDRRSAPRAHTSFLVDYALGERRDRAMVVSISARGLFLEAPDSSAAPGDEIEIYWSLAGSGSPVRVRGIVAWTRAASPRASGGLGVRFVSVSPELPPIAQRAKT